MSALTNAAWGDKSRGRLVRRSGYRERPRETRAGTVGLRVSKLRKDTHFPDFLHPRRVVEKAMTR